MPYPTPPETQQPVQDATGAAATMGGAFIGRSAAPAVPTVAKATAAVAIRSLCIGSPLPRNLSIAATIAKTGTKYRDLSATLRENRIRWPCELKKGPLAKERPK